MVVEAGLRHLERGGQLLDGPRRGPTLDHRLEDPHPGRVADRPQGLDVTDVPDVLRLEVGEERGFGRAVSVGRTQRSGSR